jgi:ferredoxin
LSMSAAQQDAIVEVVIENDEGEVLWTVQASKTKSLVESAEDVGIEIPSSCRSGACFVCAARVKEGMEFLDIGKFWIPLVDIDEDQVLTCVCGIKDDVFFVPGYHKIVLEKLL